MKKVLFISSFFFLVILFGCGGSSDDDALKTIEDGLVERWEYNDENDGKPSLLNLMHMTQIELDVIEDFDSGKIDDSSLKSLFDDYQEELKSIKSLLAEEDDINSDSVINKWNNHYDNRAKILNDINEGYELNIPDDYQDYFQEIVLRANEGSRSEASAAEENDEPTIDTEKKLGLKTEDIFNDELFEGQEDTLQSFEYDNMKIDVIDSEYAFRMYVYFVDNAEYASGIILRNSGNNKDLSQETFDFLYEQMDEGTRNASRQFKRADDDYYLIGIIFNGEIDIDNPPMEVSEIIQSDFFLDEENIEFYERALNRAEYKDIYDRVTSYIDENGDIQESDSAYEIKGILEPIQESMDKVEVQYDDFDNTSTIYYQGMTDISSENYFIPYVSSDNSEMSLLLGFEKEGWLFTDRLYLNIDGEKEFYGTFNADTQVLDGGTIREEYTDNNYDEELIERIINADEVKMRFEGENGELDKDLTANDIDALKTIYSLRNVRGELSSILNNFQK